MTDAADVAFVWLAREVGVVAFSSSAGPWRAVVERWAREIGRAEAISVRDR